MSAGQKLVAEWIPLSIFSYDGVYEKIDKSRV